MIAVRMKGRNSRYFTTPKDLQRSPGAGGLEEGDRGVARRGCGMMGSDKKERKWEWQEVECFQMFSPFHLAPSQAFHLPTCGGRNVVATYIAVQLEGPM